MSSDTKQASTDDVSSLRTTSTVSSLKKLFKREKYTRPKPDAATRARETAERLNRLDATFTYLSMR